MASALPANNPMMQYITIYRCIVDDATCDRVAKMQNADDSKVYENLIYYPVECTTARLLCRKYSECVNKTVFFRGSS